MPFTFGQRILLMIVPRLAAWTILLLGSTLRYRDVPAEGVQVGHLVPGPTVYAFWHRILLVCAHRFRNRDIAILISQSFDGELIARTVEMLGFVAIRGSSSRGGTLALKQMAEAYQAGRRCAFTADGPRGPAMKAKAGPAQLAQLSGATWVGAFYAEPDRAWTLRTWDGFLIPKPFSTVTFTWPALAQPETSAVQQALEDAVAMVPRRS